MRRRHTYIALTAVVALSFPTPASAAPGDVDTSFGVDGIASDGSVCGGSCTGPNDVAALADGQLVGVGSVSHESLPYFGVHAYASVFDADGASLAPGFGTSAGQLNAARSIAPTVTGGAFTAGWAQRCLDDRPLEECTLSRALFMVVKHTASGAADTSFDADGVALTPMGAGDAIATAVAPLPGGGAIAIGTATAFDGTPLMAFARYLQSGRLDTSFGNHGRVLIRGLTGVDLAVTGTGAIVALGDAGGALVVVRLLAGGALDGTFAENGRAVVAFPDRTVAAADLALAGRKIVVGGPVQSAGVVGFGVARLKAGGGPDLRFDGDGLAVTVFREGNAALDELAVAADGTTVAAGGNGVVRYTPRGRRDRTFSDDGRAWLPWQIRGLALQPGGIVLAVFADGLALTRLSA
jgi:uncharacterized delta-60 repeat protein